MELICLSYKVYYIILNNHIFMLFLIRSIQTVPYVVALSNQQCVFLKVVYFGITINTNVHIFVERKYNLIYNI